MSKLLRKCPCGAIPDEIGIVDDQMMEKYKFCFGSCCAEWMIEFRAEYKLGDELQELAEKAWQEANRG